MHLRESGIPDAARGGVPPLQRLGALRGRSPRLACPVRPLGRLPLGGVYIGVGLWLGFRGNAPIPWGREYGWLGAGFPSQASLLQSGVPLFYTLKTGGVSAPALRIRHPNTPHSTRQCRARGINHPARFPYPPSRTTVGDDRRTGAYDRLTRTTPPHRGLQRRIPCDLPEVYSEELPRRFR